MKIPRTAPTLSQLMRRLQAPGFDHGRVFSKASGPLISGRYLHWDQVTWRQPPEGLTHEDWWFLAKLARGASRKGTPLRDVHGASFTYCTVDPIPERLNEIDLRAGGYIRMPEPLTSPELREQRDQYYVGSLMEEAITSSQLEGATTTRRVAKEMLRTGREPRDNSERMIVNNFATMRKIRDLKNEPLSRELICEIHRTVTEGTLDDPSAAGRFRRDDEPIVVQQGDTILHTPPPAHLLDERIARLCDFGNEIGDEFVHPAIRAIVLHFWLGYDHPFCDGNGRTARAVFYWSMLRHGYWMFEFTSISHIILQGRSKYARAYLHTETDENDLTYFIIYHLDVIHRAIQALHEYIARKMRETTQVEAELRGIELLSHRQRAIVRHAFLHPGKVYTVEEHRRSHDVVYETARADLLDLAARELLAKERIGRKWLFSAPPDLAERLAQMGRARRAQQPAQGRRRRGGR